MNDCAFSGYAEGNQFSDSAFQDIYTKVYHRKSEQFIERLDAYSALKPVYRQNALLFSSSLRDVSIIMDIADYLTDKDFEVRKAAAFALGQTYEPKAASVLMQAYQTEKSPAVKRVILQAIGKTGSSEDLGFVCGNSLKFSYESIIEGATEAIGNFAERGIVSEQSLEFLVEVLKKQKLPDEITFKAAYALARSKADVGKYIGTLRSLYEEEAYIFTKSNIIKALAITERPETADFLLIVAKDTEQDYRIRVNALRSLYSYSYEKTAATVRKMLNDKNYHIADAAADFFVIKGKQRDAQDYYELAKAENRVGIKAKLFTAALRYTEDKEKLSEEIKRKIEKTKDVYLRAAYIEALGEDLTQFRYIMHKTFFDRHPVISTAGIKALSSMRYSSGFEKFAKSHKLKDMSAEEAFAELFKKAILSGDNAMVSIAAQTIREPRFNYRSLYENTYFIKQAMKKCVLPNDVEAYRELQKTDAFINGTETKEPDLSGYYFSADMDCIKAIPPKLKMRVTTSVGSFIIETYVNKAPVTVLRFIDLVLHDYYSGKPFHRVVSDFVVQTGCSRGDGWGGGSELLRSELSSQTFTEGSLGMASSGRDTESAQWFITTSPAPHLNGKYTHFGSVVEGMEVVHKLQVGDKITGIEILF